MNPRGIAQRHILVVDDDPVVCETVHMVLASEGHQVEDASSGAEALARFEPGKFDVVFTDYLMPAMRGDELATAIKRRSPLQLVVMLTAYPEELRNAIGVDLLIGKPFEIENLRAAVGRFVPVPKLEFSV
jgi:CheY-like chemotaxis protein